METKSLRIAKIFEVFTKINHIIRIIIMILFLTEGMLWVFRGSYYNSSGGGTVFAFFYVTPIFLLDMLTLALFLLSTILLVFSISNPYKLIIKMTYKEYAIESGKTLLASILAIAIPTIATFSGH